MFQQMRYIDAYTINFISVTCSPHNANTISRYQRTNRLIPFISKMANTDYQPIIGASLLICNTWMCDITFLILLKWDRSFRGKVSQEGWEMEYMENSCSACSQLSDWGTLKTTTCKTTILYSMHWFYDDTTLVTSPISIPCTSLTVQNKAHFLEKISRCLSGFKFLSLVLCSRHIWVRPASERLWMFIVILCCKTDMLHIPAK